MTAAGPREAQQVRTAEVIASACLATDLGMAFPFEHGLHATLIAMRLADELGVDRETAMQTYYVSLLMYSGCTTDTHISSRIFRGGMAEHVTPVQFGSKREVIAGVIRALPEPGGASPARALAVARRLPEAARHRAPHFAALCEVATMLAERLGLPPTVHSIFTKLTERWDGNGVLGRARGDAIPLPLRIVHVARDAAYQRVLGGDERATAVIRRRSGQAFDPDVVTTFLDRSPEILAAADVGDSAWDTALGAEPRPSLMLEADAIDRAIAAIGDFADLVAPAFSGHSAGVAELATNAAVACGFDGADVSTIRRAAHVHDVGRVAIHPRIWNTEGSLGADAWEQVRLHAYYSERVLSRADALAPLVDIACAHHERLDGSGYHRGATAAALSPAMRMLATADAFHAMAEPRPHRPAFPAEDAARMLGDEARAGRLDPAMVAAVLEVAGQPPPPVERPAGLTPREVEVIALLARGLQTKQVARVLGISAKTADRHIQHAYRKAGVSTRAGATLFAMENGLVTWGGFRISGRAEHP